MAFKLAVGNRVNVNLKFKIKGARAADDKVHSFSLDMDRLSQEEIAEAQASAGTIPDFLRAHTHGWSGQRLVLNADDSPAEFSPEAFDAMLQVAGVAVLIYRTYLAEVGAQEKN